MPRLIARLAGRLLLVLGASILGSAALAGVAYTIARLPIAGPSGGRSALVVWAAAAAWLVVGGVATVAVARLAARRPRVAIALALGAYGASRVAVLVAIDQVLVSDFASYHRLAIGWLHGAPPVADVPMGYPIVLATAYRLGGVSAASAEAVNLVAAMATASIVAWLGYRAAGRERGPRVAAAAVMLLSFTPSELWFTVVRGTETLYAALVTGAVALVAVGRGRTAAVAALSGGLVLGLSTFVRATSLAIAPTVALLPWLVRPSMRGGRLALAVAVGVAAGLAPIVATNLHYLGEASPSTSRFVGWQLLTGSNPESLGRFATSDAARLDELTGTRPGAVAAAWESGHVDLALVRAAARRDDVAFELFVDRVRADPGRVLALLPAKFVVGWGGNESGPSYALDTRNAGFGRPFEVAWLTAQAWWIGLAALAAPAVAFTSRRARPLALATAAVVVPIAMGMLVLETQGRYKEYVVPLVAVLAALTLDALARRRERP